MFHATWYHFALFLYFFSIGGPEENPVCESTQKYIFPKVAKTVRGQWRYIINIQDLYMQGVSVEICKATGNIIKHNLFVVSGFFKIIFLS